MHCLLIDKSVHIVFCACSRVTKVVVMGCRTFIGAVERAETNISIDNIARISAALGVSAAVLMVED